VCPSFIVGLGLSLAFDREVLLGLFTRFAHGTDFFSVQDELAIRELVRLLLDESEGVLGTLLGVEMDMKGANTLASFGVELVLEVAQELLKPVEATASRDVVDVDRSLEDGRHLALVLYLVNSLHDQLSNFTAQDLRNLAAFSPEDVSDLLLALFSTVVAHVESEMLVHHQRDELTLLDRQVVVALRALVHHDVSQLSLHLFYPG
jgi:hypothetical protein